VLLSAEISGFTGGAPTKHRIRDLSTTGARVDRAGALKVGATVLVSVGGLEHVGATVVWVRDDFAGLQFAEAIDPDAARSKAIITPAHKPAPPPAPTPGDSKPIGGGERRPGAGWIADLDSPYRK